MTDEHQPYHTKKWRENLRVISDQTKLFGSFFFCYSIVIQTTSIVNRIGNLNFDVSYKVSF